MENLLMRLLLITKKEFRERYKKPEWDEDLELYIIPNNLLNSDNTFNDKALSTKKAPF